MATTYAPAYLLLDFAQGLPGDPDTFELLTTDTKKDAHLRYRDRITEQTYTVPNIPCNQQTWIRLGTLEFYLKMAYEAKFEFLDRWTKQSRLEYIAKLEARVAALKQKVQMLATTARQVAG